jgi:hypothetical protein
VQHHTGRDSSTAADSKRVVSIGGNQGIKIKKTNNPVLCRQQHPLANAGSNNLKGA